MKVKIEKTHPVTTEKQKKRMIKGTVVVIVLWLIVGGLLFLTK